MTKSFVQETNFAHKDIHQEAECVTPTVTLPQSHREAWARWIWNMDPMYVTRQVTVIAPGHF